LTNKGKLKLLFCDVNTRCSGKSLCCKTSSGSSFCYNGPSCPVINQGPICSDSSETPDCTPGIVKTLFGQPSSKAAKRDRFKSI